MWALIRRMLVHFISLPLGWRVTFMIVGGLMGILGFVAPWEYLTYSPTARFAARHPQFGGGYTSFVSRATLAGLVDSWQAAEIRYILYTTVAVIALGLLTPAAGDDSRQGSSATFVRRSVDVITSLVGLAQVFLLGFIFTIIRNVEGDWQHYFLMIHGDSRAAKNAAFYIIASPFVGLLLLAGGFILATVGAGTDNASKVAVQIRHPSSKEVFTAQFFAALAKAAVYIGVVGFLSYVVIPAV